MLETERLRLYPASRAQMEAAIAAETDAELRKAYQEMLACCLAQPEAWDWYAMWRIELRDGTPIGDLCFKGLDANGVAELGYGLGEAYRGRGFASEAVRAVCGWALAQPLVTAIEAEAEEGNRASQRVLAKCGFVPNGQLGEEGPRFVLTPEAGANKEGVCSVQEGTNGCE